MSTVVVTYCDSFTRYLMFFFFSSRRRHTRCALVTGVQTCALPIWQPDAARADLDRALELVPGDPMGWLLSATLARRQNDIARAALHIAEAEKRAPGDPNIALEAGNIAGLQGRLAEAREKWSAAAKGDGPARDRKSTRLNSSH